jgi:hypothetical protein
MEVAMGEFSGRRTGESLEDRIGKLEDIEAIKALKARYAYYADHGYDADGMASLYVEDAVSDSGPFGTAHGRDAIRAATASFKTKIVWALHFMICPVVNVSDDGQTATGSWYLIQFATMVGADRPGSTAPNDAVVLSAIYNDTFVKENGEWKFKTVNVEFHQVSDLDKGWVLQQFRPS